MIIRIAIWSQVALTAIALYRWRSDSYLVMHPLPPLPMPKPILTIVILATLVLALAAPILILTVESLRASHCLTRCFALMSISILLSIIGILSVMSAFA